MHGYSSGCRYILDGARGSQLGHPGLRARNAARFCPGGEAQRGMNMSMGIYISGSTPETCVRFVPHPYDLQRAGRFYFVRLEGIFLLMMREIVQTGALVLREKAKEISKDDFGSAQLRTLIEEMKELLGKEKYGVALAAPQVGESLRLFIVAGSAIEKRKKRLVSEESAEDSIADMPAEDQVYINPTLRKISRIKKDKHEGCLSVRGKWGMVPRAEKATIEAYDESGRKFMRGASGLLAHIFQHEMDHLEGVLYTDKAKELYDEHEETET